MKTDRLLKTVISLALILQIHAVSFAVPAGEIVFSPGWPVNRLCRTGRW